MNDGCRIMEGKRGRNAECGPPRARRGGAPRQADAWTGTGRRAASGTPADQQYPGEATAQKQWHAAGARGTAAGACLAAVGPVGYYIALDREPLCISKTDALDGDEANVR